MVVPRHRQWMPYTLVVLLLIWAATAQAGGFPHGFRDSLGACFDADPFHRPDDIPTRRWTRPGDERVRRLRHWSEIAINASGLDHSPVAPGEQRVFGEQYGPTRASRAMAIVHIAIFEAINAIAGGYQSYLGLPPASADTSMSAAMALAAHDSLAALFPSQRPRLAVLLVDDLLRIRDSRDPRALARGIKLGRRAAAASLARRANDGSQHTEPRLGIEFITGDAPGMWRQDPISKIPLALGAYWGGVMPFVLSAVAQFRVPPPPALNSPAYAAAYAEVLAVGGDGAVTPTARTAEQTLIGIYWGYDGTPSLGTPVRLYNQIALHIADQMGSNGVELARLLALVNVAMADAGIAIWESKYHYEFWRPVTGIREADEGTGPIKAGDGNPATRGNPTFTPFGAPASNIKGPNFTPPFPAYPSGHAGFGAALFQMLRNFYHTDTIPFIFVSDELNGVTRDNQGSVRPRLSRSFASLSQAEEENAQSRMYLGIHWAFDKTAGLDQGRRVADYVFQHAFVPRR